MIGLILIGIGVISLIAAFSIGPKRVKDPHRHRI